MAKLNTNSNVYTIIYASVMVIIVAFLLAFVSSALKPAQDANVAIDKKSQILAALNVRGLDKSDIPAKYEELIKETCVMDAEGNIIEGADAFDVETKEIGEKFPIYKALNAEGVEVSVFPLKGRGLWGGLWGYVAVDSEGEVTGAYFDHESETAGLGALIKEVPFQSQFVGRPVFDADGNVVLTVVKKGSAKEAYEVDGVTGATLTSKGTGEMVKSGLQAYVDVLKKSMGGCPKAQCCGKQTPCQKAQGCPEKPECCKEQADSCQQQSDCCSKAKSACEGCSEKAAAHKCESGNGCCKSGKCDKSGSYGKSGCEGEESCCGHK